MELFTKIKNYSKYSILIFCLIFTACTKETSKINHENALPAEKFSVAVNTDDEDNNFFPPPASIADDDVVKFNQDNNIYGIYKNLETATRQGNGVELSYLEEVAKTILSPKLIGSSHAYNNFLFRTYYYFNNLLLKNFKEENVSLNKKQEILKKYEDVLFYGCNADLKKCKFIDFFSTIQNTRDILIEDIEVFHGDSCASAESNIYYNKIRYGFALHYNVEVESQKLNALHLRCIIDRFNYFAQKLQNKLSADEKSKIEAEIDSLKADTEHILKTVSYLSKGPYLNTALENFENKLGPKKYNAERLPSGNYAKIAIFRLQELYLKQKSDWINDASYVQEIHEDNTKTNDQFVYDEILDLFKKEKSNILKNFFVTPLAERDALFTIVESIAIKRWSPQLGIAYYQQLKLGKNEEEKKKKVEKILKNYAQVMFFRQVVNTNAKMGEFYSKNTQMTEDLIDQAIRTSQSYSSDWNIFYDRIAMLRQFASAVLQVPVNKLAHIGLDSNSLLLSSYYMISFPHMLMLAYVAAKKKFEITIYTYFGIFKFNHVDILEWILEGGIKPWFVYAPGKSVNETDARFNGYQVLQSMYYAFRTETFKVFGVNEEEFLKVIFESFATRHVSLFRNSFTVLNEAVQEMNVEYSKLKEVCPQEEKWWQAYQSGKKFTPTYEAKINFDDLKEGILSKTSWFRAITGKSGKERNINYRNELVGWDIKGIGLIRQGMQERLDLMLLGSSRVVRYIDSIIEIYKQYHLDLGEQKLDIYKKINFFSQDYEKLKHESRKFYTFLNKLNNEYVKGCALNLFFHENILYDQLRWAEVQHLRNIYKDKKAIMNGTSSYEDVVRKYQFSGYEADNYVGRDDFDGEYYTYTNLDAHMRLSQQIQSVSPNIEVILPKSGELHWKEAYKETKKYEKIPFMADNKGTLVSEEQFIRDALAFGGKIDERTSRSFVNWETTFALFDLLGELNQRILPYFVLLYKLGKVEAYPADRPQCMGANTPSAKDCPVQYVQLMDADYLMNENWKLAQLVSVKQEEEELYSLNSISSKFDLRYMSSTFSGTGKYIYDWSTDSTLLNPRTGEHTAFFDFLYNLLIVPMAGISLKMPWSLPDDDERMGYYDPRRKGLREQLAEYYQSLQRMEFMPFKVDQKTSTLVNRIYQNAFKEQEIGISTIENKIKEWEENDKRNGVVRRLRRNLNEQPYSGPYITEHYVSDYKKLMRDFHRQTEGFYQNTSTSVQ